MATSQNTTTTEASSSSKHVTLEYGRKSSEERQVITQYIIYGGIGFAIILTCAILPAVWDYLDGAPGRGRVMPVITPVPPSQTYVDTSQPIIHTYSSIPKTTLFAQQRTSSSGATFMIYLGHALRQNQLFVGGGSKSSYDRQYADFITPYRIGSDTFFIAVMPIAINAIEIIQTQPAKPRELAKIAEGTTLTRIYPGEPDSKDRSHFTIRYELNGKSEIIDGYVDNAGQVTLSQRCAGFGAELISII